MYVASIETHHNFLCPELGIFATITLGYLPGGSYRLKTAFESHNSISIVDYLTTPSLFPPSLPSLSVSPNTLLSHLSGFVENGESSQLVPEVGCVDGWCLTSFYSNISVWLAVFLNQVVRLLSDAEEETVLSLASVYIIERESSGCSREVYFN